MTSSNLDTTESNSKGHATLWLDAWIMILLSIFLD